LSPLEEAEGYQSLMDQHGMTQAQIAQAVGKNRSTVANMLRLLRLPPSIRRMVQKGDLSMGHARALLSIDDTVLAADLAREAVKHGWSVREIERRTQSRPSGGTSSKASGPVDAPRRDPAVVALEEALQEHLATRVVIKGAGAAAGRGTIEIPFGTSEEFERIFALVVGREASDVLG
jgi:ParB family chromosome partitioning protein